MNLSKLKEKRLNFNYTQKQMADRLGIGEKTYNRKELGVYNFKVSEIREIRLIFNLDMEELEEIFYC